MHLLPPNNERLKTLFSWFDDDHSVAIWGGPDMRLPMTFESMQLDGRMNTLASRFLVDNAKQVVGFGQYYDRMGRCHLGRLVIAPDQRGKRHGHVLIDELISEGTKVLDLPEQSLFVLQDNPRAKKLYERIGFKIATYPGSDINRNDIDYMVRPAAAPQSGRSSD